MGLARCDRQQTPVGLVGRVTGYLAPAPTSRVSQFGVQRASSSAVRLPGEMQTRCLDPRGGGGGLGGKVSTTHHPPPK